MKKTAPVFTPSHLQLF